MMVGYLLKTRVSQLTSTRVGGRIESEELGTQKTCDRSFYLLP